MAIVTVALNRNSTSFADRVFQRGNGLLLRCSRTGHVENFFLHNRAVQIIGAIAQRNLRQRQSGADPVGSQMVDVIKVDPADSKVSELLNR